LISLGFGVAQKVDEYDQYHQGKNRAQANYRPDADAHRPRMALTRAKIDCRLTNGQTPMRILSAWRSPG
jgi:hypothetical protein